MAIKQMRKGGIIFTLMAIIVITIVLFAIRPASYAPLEQRIPVIHNRVGVASEHLFKLQHVYLERAMIHSGYLALNAYIKYVNLSLDEPVDLDEANQYFFEIITNNSMNTTGLNCSVCPVRYYTSILENHSLNDKLNEFTNLSKEFLNLDTDITVNDIQLFQSNLTGPWEIGIWINVSIYLNGSIATWNIIKYNTTAVFSIIGLEDYMYLRNTRILAGGPYKNYVYAANFTYWNYTTFSHFIGNRTYKHEPTAPGFLNRMINSLTESECCGIESVVYQGWGAGEYNNNMSFIDYCYWGQGCNGSTPGGYFSLYNVTGITSDTYPLKIEPYHYAEERYNLTYQEGLLVPN